MRTVKQSLRNHDSVHWKMQPYRMLGPECGVVAMITPDLLRTRSLFASLPEEDLARLAQAAADVRLESGEFLIREGQRLNFFVLLEGRLELSKELLGRDVVQAQLGPGDFFGEASALFGIPALCSLRAVSRCRVAQVGIQHLQELIQGPTACGATILKALKERLAGSEKYALGLPSPRVKVIGSRPETDLSDIRTFLRLNRISYEWIDRRLQSERIPSCLPSNHDGPTVVVDDSCCLKSPLTVRKVAEALGMPTRPNKETYDVLVVGGGPAGLAAAVCGASEGLSVLLVEQKAAGGQAGTSSRIDNYLGFSNGISGDELSERALKQAKRFGAEMVVTREVTAIVALPDGYRIEVDGGEHINCKTVVLTTGVEWRTLEAEGLDRLTGKGVFYGAAAAEPCHVRGEEVFLVGGGNSAAQAAVFFANYARSVTLLIRGDKLEAGMSQYLVQQIGRKANIRVETRTQVVSVAGEHHLETVYTRRQDQEVVRREAGVLCVMIGANATTNWLPEALQRDEKGFVRTGRDVTELSNWTTSRLPFHLETSLPGLFCAGDVRHGSMKRVSSAVGEGSMAIAFIHQYLAL
jgi:thioredoxin reductase (NADPH)